ncbi:DNA mismatch repair protein MutL [Dentipellis sp. KUC8613]|nr:DNA mismatch repair protein MutL [Dentipellis sp. KUC8613]
MAAQEATEDELIISSEPAPIRRLEQSLINRIAAGEIIHRPSSALKELLENSLDAGATSIRVTVKEGGLRLLQIQDNGSGIQKASLPILAHRHTTSKLSSFSDLSHLTTYGFRGEALASISHVADLSVVTKARGEQCAWRVCYLDGEMVPSKAGLSAEPKPAPGNFGTTITVENLFHNTPARLSALRSSSEEYARILDVVTKYAVHNSHVAFFCKKVGGPSTDLSTPASGTTKQAIGMLYGQGIAKELLALKVTPTSTVTVSRSGKRKREPADEDGEDANNNGDDEEAKAAWTADVQFTSANYHAKKMVFLLFINHRLVESSRIKRAIESVYTGILPKGSSPFVYLSLQLDPTTVDVNVHPTKREVHFLDEETITERVADAMQAQLAGMGERVFEYQTLLTGGLAPEPEKSRKGKEKEKEKTRSSEDEEPDEESSEQAMALKKKAMPSQHKVRTSMADRTLDSMFPMASGSQAVGQSGNGNGSPGVGGEREKAKAIKESECFLTSVQMLRQRVSRGRHKQLTEILEKHTFVGVVDLERELSLVQHSTRLYLVSHGALAEELFYQLGLRQFGNLPRLQLDPPPSLRDLVTLAVDAEDALEIAASPLSKPQIIDAIVETLTGRREMLEEYFSLVISPDGKVEALPMLLREYTPNLDKSPLFLMRLGPQVNWTSEAECFETFLRELAYFYVPGPGPLAQEQLQPPSPSSSPPDGSQPEAQAVKAEKWQIEHVLFPAFRRYLVAPKSLLTRDVVQVADLPDLYRVFERC